MMRTISDPSQFWIYLAEQPLFFLVLTVLAYIAADRISQASGRHPVANPVLIAVVIVGTVLIATARRMPVISKARASCMCCLARQQSRWRCRSSAIAR